MVHDMVTRSGYLKQGLLRRLVTRARALDVCAPYCTDDNLTVDGALVAVNLGLIDQHDLTLGRDRAVYTQLPGRADGHLAHSFAAADRAPQAVLTP
jgi:hypothetical protein